MCSIYCRNYKSLLHFISLWLWESHFLRTQYTCIFVYLNILNIIQINRDTDTCVLLPPDHPDARSQLQSTACVLAIETSGALGKTIRIHYWILPAVRLQCCQILLLLITIVIGCSHLKLLEQQFCMYIHLPGDSWQFLAMIAMLDLQ